MGRSEPATTTDADLLRLRPGGIVELVGPAGAGLTRVGLSLLADPARRLRVAYVDVRGWFCPLAAWESGIPPDRLVVVRCPDRRLWPGVVAAMVDGLPALYAEVPRGLPEGVVRRLSAFARSRGTAVVLRPLDGGLPAGTAYLRAEALEVRWEGPDGGHGRLERRRVVMRVSGKGAGGRERLVELEDDGSNPVRVVPGMAAASERRATG